MNTASYITELRKCRTLAGCCSGLVGPPGPQGPGVPPLYASFISKSKQKVVAINANPNSVAITYDLKTIGGGANINVVNGVYPGSKIIIPTTGTYRILFSAICDSDGGLHSVEIFPTINGNSVEDSNSRVNVDFNTEVALTVEFFLFFNANDIFELRMTGDSTAGASNAHLSYSAPVGANPPSGPIIPAVPSIILTIQLIA
jgi:hypothetical protein